MKLQLIPLFVFLLAACETGPASRDLGAASKPLTDSNSTRQSDTELSQAVSTELNLDLSKAPSVSTGKVYNLPQLIDIAQQRNPAAQTLTG